MTCARAREAFVEGWGREGSGNSSVLDHAGACPACAEELRRLSSLLETVSADEVPDPGAGYWETFAARVRARTGEGTPRLRRFGTAPRLSRRAPWIPAAAAAAAILAVASFWLVATRTSVPGGGDLATLRSRLETNLESATDADRTAAADILPMMESPTDSEAWLQATWAPDEESAEESLSRVTTILSPSEGGGLPDTSGWAEGLSKEQIDALIKDLAAGEGTGSGGKPEAGTG